MSPRKSRNDGVKGKKKRPYRKTHPRWGAQAAPIVPTIEDLIPSAVRARLLRIQAVRMHDGVAWRPPTNPKARHSSIVYGPTCQHPRSRALGECQLDSIGEFEIPAEYQPHTRHTDQVDIPRPRALLCRQHRSMVEAFKSGRQISGNSHEAWCDVCNHEDSQLVDRTVNSWLHWAISTDIACQELQISHRAWYTHVGYFDLYDKKAAKVNVRRALVIAAEKGLSAGGHSVKTGISALQELGRQRGDAKQIDVNVKGAIGVGVMNMDLTKLTDNELAEHFEQLAKQIRNNGAGMKQLPSPAGQTIDLPRESVRVVSNTKVDDR